MWNPFKKKIIWVDYTGNRKPFYATKTASGADLYVNGVEPCYDEPYQVKPGEWVLIKTGVSVAIPVGYEGQIRSRSGLALRQGLVVLNAPGTIDSDYRGEIGVIILNLGKVTIVFKDGQRIAQLVIAPVVRAHFKHVKKLTTTIRGSGNYGHTGER